MCASTTISLKFSEGSQPPVTWISGLYSCWHDIYIPWHSYCIMAAILFNQVSGFLFLAISEISESFTQKCSLKNYSKQFRQIHKNRSVSMSSLNKVARYTTDKKTPPDDYFWTLKAWNKTLKLLLCSLGFFTLFLHMSIHI